MLVPKLRFKREDGTDYPEWEQYRLEDTVDFLDEKRKPITSKYRKAGQYPYYGASGIIDFIDDYIFDEELVLLSEDGANIVDRNYRVAFIATGKYWVNNHAHCLRPKQGFASYFISEALENIDYTVYNTGSAQPKLNQEVCRNLPLMCPCLEEQQKIANFLSTVDEVIAQSEAEVQNLEQQKKAAMQKIFSQEVRFKREDGTDYPEWEEKSFVSFCDVITKQTGFDYTKTIKRALLTEQKDGTLPYLQTKNFTGINFDYSTDYYIPIEVANQFERIILDRKCLLFSIVGASVGNIALFPNTVKCFLSGAICVAKPIKEEWAAYLYHFMCSELGQSQIRNATKGSGQATITIEDIRAFSIKTPCLEEQRKIADFLSAYDEAISYAKQELDKWKELKKGLLQQMFV
ncbi:MAG: restriction endonuclease subunit S [Huintestinicola sp.]